MLFARDPLDFRLTPSVRKYCQLVRFAQGWRDPISGERGVNWGFGYWQDYEFRTVAGSATKVLVAGLIKVGYKEPNVYTVNKYAFDLATPASSVRVATEAEWQTGTVMPLGRTFTFYFAADLDDAKLAEVSGRRFTKTGQHWLYPPHDADRLSPNGSWLVLQSITGRVDTNRLMKNTLGGTLLRLDA